MSLPPDYTALRHLAAEIVHKGRSRKKGARARELCALTRLGHPEADGVRFTPADRELLRLYFREHFGDDLRPLGERTTAASVVPDEKSGTQGVFAELLNLGGHVPLRSGDFPALGPGMVLSIAPALFAPEKCRRLLLVENGALLVHWDALLRTLPPDFAPATVLFRGAGPNVRAVEVLLRTLPETTEVAYYFDYDPAGLLMAAHYLGVRPGSLVLPATLSPQVLRLNKSASFTAQISQLKALEGQPDADWRIIRALSVLKAHELALTQENLLAHTIPLRLSRPQGNDDNIKGNGEETENRVISGED